MAENNNTIRSRSNVKIQEVNKVKPLFSDSSTTPFTLPLTHFDTRWFKFPPVERLFFYQTDSDSDSESFRSVIIPKLKQSLSLTLQHYIPLAGHLMWPVDAEKPAIYYFPDQNDGVSFTVAESVDADFDRLCGYGIIHAIELHPFVPRLSISEDKAEVVAIQITLFPDHGFSIGISCHHSVLDGKSTTMFLKSWAHLCKHLQNPSLPPELTPCLDRTVIKDPNGDDLSYAKNWQLAFLGSTESRNLKVMPVQEPDSNLVRMTFEFSREDLNFLKGKIGRILKDEVHISSFVVAFAHVFVCLVKARGVEAETTVRFIVPADGRARLDFPVPDNYFGNCVGGDFGSAKAKDFIQENGIACIASKLSDLIRGLNGSAIEGSVDQFLKRMEVMKNREQLKLSISGSNRLGVYGSDFGWGRPKKVEIVSIDKNGAISLAESKDGSSGFEIGIVLEKQQMEVFASLFVDGLKHL